MLISHVSGHFIVKRINYKFIHVDLSQSIFDKDPHNKVCDERTKNNMERFSNICSMSELAGTVIKIMKEKCVPYSRKYFYFLD